MYTLKSVSATLSQLDPRNDGVFGLQSQAYNFMTNNMDIVTSGRTIVHLDGNLILSRYFEIWDVVNEVNVISNDFGESVSLADAGPTYWGVTSQQGIDFLEGSGTIPNYEILTYCTNCLERTGLPYNVILPYQTRFNALFEMVSRYGTTEGYLLYAYSSEGGPPNIYASTFDTVGSKYVFVDMNGNSLSILNLVEQLNLPPGVITSSLDNATPIIPEPTLNYIVSSCCDSNVQEIISGTYTIGDIVCAINYPSHSCWEVIGTSTSPVTFIPFICKGVTYTDCATCVADTYSYGCEAFWEVQSCCDSRTAVALISAQIGKYFVDSNNETWQVTQSSLGPATTTLLSEVSGCIGSACFDTYQISKCCDGTIGVAQNFLAIGKSYVDVNGDCWTVTSTSTGTPNVTLSINRTYNDPFECTSSNNHCYYLVRSCADNNIYAKAWGNFTIGVTYIQNGQTGLDCWTVIEPLNTPNNYQEVDLNWYEPRTSCYLCNFSTNIYTQVINCCTSESKYVFIVNSVDRLYQTFTDPSGQCWTVQNQVSTSQTGSLLQVTWFTNCSECNSSYPCS